MKWVLTFLREMVSLVNMQDIFEVNFINNIFNSTYVIFCGTNLMIGGEIPKTTAFTIIMLNTMGNSLNLKLFMV